MIKEKVLEILQEINEEITEGVDLIEEGLMNSFVIVDVVMELEDAFGIEIDPEEIIADNFQTVDAIVDMMERLVP